MSNKKFTVKVFPHNLEPPPDYRHPEDNTPLSPWYFEGLIEKFINQALENLEKADNNAYDWEFKQVDGNYVYFQGKTYA